MRSMTATTMQIAASDARVVESFGEPGGRRVVSGGSAGPDVRLTAAVFRADFRLAIGCYLATTSSALITSSNAIGATVTAPG